VKPILFKTGGSFSHFANFWELNELLTSFPPNNQATFCDFQVRVLKILASIVQQAFFLFAQLTLSLIVWYQSGPHELYEPYH
jgi:hypothetical protein